MPTHHEEKGIFELQINKKTICGLIFIASTDISASSDIGGAGMLSTLKAEIPNEQIFLKIDQNVCREIAHTELLRSEHKRL